MFLLVYTLEAILAQRLSLLEVELATRVQIPDDAFCTFFFKSTRHIRLIGHAFTMTS